MPCVLQKNSVSLWSFLFACCFALLTPLRTEAQSFVEVANSFPGLIWGSSAWGDYDNDGWLDLLITGFSSNGGVCRVYHNNGGASFTDIHAAVPDLGGGSAAWGDYDNDGDLDFVVTGVNSNGFGSTLIFRNDGNGIFTQIPTSLLGVQVGTVSWVDYDNDGDLDILLLGTDQYGGRFVRFYRNDGQDTFTSVPTTLPAGAYASVSWADYDNDGDADLLLAASLSSGADCRIYRNDGAAIFTDVQAGLQWSDDGTVAWGDYDNDGKPDILQTGTSTNNLTQVYHNLGNNLFIPNNAPFVQLYDSRAGWGDFDNDGQLDFVVCGFGGPAYTLFYRNAGNGSFTAGGGVKGLAGGSLAWGDFNNDGRLDLIQAGWDGSTQTSYFTKLYRNQAPFPNSPPAPPGALQAIVSSTNSILLRWGPGSDPNQTNGFTYNLRVGSSPGSANILSPMADLNTGFRRIAQPGIAGSGRVWKLNNLAGGTYYWSVQTIDHSLAGSVFAREATFHINAAPVITSISNQVTSINTPTPALAFTIGDQETAASALAVTASSSNTNTVPVQNIMFGGSESNRTVTIFPATNEIGTTTVTITVTDGDGNSTNTSFQVSVASFTDIGLKLPGLTARPSLAWADFDNDGFLDIVISGNNGTGPFSDSAYLYRNLGGINFILFTNQFLAFQQGQLAVGDYDNDGRLDIVAAGVTSTGNSQFNAVFHQETNVSFVTTYSGLPFYEAAIGWADFNNDGRLDYAVSGWNSTASSISNRLYQQTALGSFALFTNLPGAILEGLCWGDYDNDGDMDFFICGESSIIGFSSQIFRNNGKGNFADSNLAFAPGWYAAAWGDFDNDGDLDLLFSQQSFDPTNQFTVIYRNDGTNGFHDIGVRLPGIKTGSLAWGDFDNDGLLDILMTGTSSTNGTDIFLTRVYRNLGNGSFRDVHADLPGLADGRAVWGDFDNDGNLDILLTGSTNNTSSSSNLITRIYHNDSPTHNSVPSAPAQFDSLVVSNMVTLRWYPSADSNQAGGLSYNLRIGRSSGASDILSPMADLSNGKRRLPQRGNADENLRWPIYNLTPGTYYWSVQAIDHAYAGSRFSTEQSFVISQPPTVSAISNQTVHVGSSVQVSFNAQDPETPPQYLVISASSSNTNLVAGFLVSGSDTNRTLVINLVTNQVGSATITVTVADFDGNSTNTTFVLSVINSSPVISYIPDQVIFPGASAGPLPFVIGDFETAASNLLVTAISSDTNLVPVENIVLAGSQSNRSVTIIPATNRAGSCVITVSVADRQGGIATDSFVLRIREFVDGYNLPALGNSSAAWGDYDNDGRLDLILAGDIFGNPTARIFHNNGNGTFTDIQVGLVGVSSGSAAWGDFNNDGRLDLVLTGSSTNNQSGFCRIYRNDGNGVFTDINAGLQDASTSSAIWGDFDNDGKLDLFLSGLGPWGPFCRIYRNNGNGTFSDVAATSLPQEIDHADWADYDRDGKPDLLLVTHNTSLLACHVLRNNGDTTFSDINTGLPAVGDGAVAWGDANADGWPDILVAGSTSTGQLTQIFFNNRSGAFSPGPVLSGLSRGSVAWGDYDNDGDLDILAIGTSQSGPASKVFRNNGNGTFSDTDALLGSYDSGACIWGDYDNDGRLDILLTGNTTLGPATTLYSSVTPVTNAPPGIPTNLTQAIMTNSVTFSWSAPMDAQSPAGVLSYNLRVGTTPGGQDVVSPSSASNGFRRLATFGNAGQNNSWTLTDLPISGTYYWSVQAVDGAFAGSAFAPEQVFTATFSPTARTLPASGVSNNLATLNGLISAKGAETMGWFEYGLTPNLDNTILLAVAPSNALYLAASVQLTNIVPGSNYSFRLVASNRFGLSPGRTLAFFPGDPPLITAQPPLATNLTQATLQVLVNPNHSSANVVFEYGLTATYGTATAPLSLVSNVNFVSVFQNLSGLTPGSTYHYRVVATNFYGITLGPDLTFATTSQPTAVTTNASNISFTSAVLNGLATPNSKSTTVYFEYGPTTNYGNYSAFTNIGSGLNPMLVSQIVSGLSAGTTNHFRIVAANSSATAFGADRTFVTFSPFTNSFARLITNLQSAAVAWGDFNNDGKLDLAITGSTNINFPPIFRLYQNDGSNGFTELTTAIQGVRAGAIAWGDYNNDGLLDLLVTGSTNSGTAPSSRIYRNNGNGVFTDINVALPGVINSAVAWADFNNDGRLDFVVTGLTNASFAPISRIYLNQGDGSFSNANANLPGAYLGSVAIADFNNDGKMDIALAGLTNLSTSSLMAGVFRNNGSNNFSNINAGLPGIRDGSLAWGDFDADGDPDLLLCGNTNASSTLPISRIYRNNGNGTFSDINAGFAGVTRAVALWGDFDNDGRLDAFISGDLGTSAYSAALYHNNGNGSFDLMIPGVAGAGSVAAAAGDFNGDSRLDVIVSGVTISSPLSALYRNLFSATNAPPSVPGNPGAIPSGRSATFRWDASSDDLTASAGLSYNLRLGTTPSGQQIVSSHAAGSGVRTVAAMGNVGQRRLWTITNLPLSGTFYWSVQAIDSAFAGSAFAAEQMFVIAGPPTFSLGALQNLTTNAVTLNAFVDANGFDTVAYFQWGSSTNYENTSAASLFGSTIAYQPINSTLTNLLSLMSYHWRLVASNSAGQVFSPDQIFITPSKPLILSALATNLSAMRVTLQASINPGALSATALFQFGLTTNHGNTTSLSNIGNNASPVLLAQTISGLSADTLYFARPMASNALGLVFGPEISFRTVPPPVFTGYSYQNKGQFLLSFSGTAGLTYNIYGSTNLLDWTFLSLINSSSNGFFQFLDPGASNFQQRFYRVTSP